MRANFGRLTMLRVTRDHGQESSLDVSIIDETKTEKSDRSAYALCPRLRRRSDFDIILVAKIGNVVAGALFARIPAERFGESNAYGYFDSIYVKEEFKSLGIEKALFLELLRKEKEKGKTHLYVEAKAPPEVTIRDLLEEGAEVKRTLDEQGVDFSFFYEIQRVARIVMSVLEPKYVNRDIINPILYDLNSLKV